MVRLYQAINYVGKLGEVEIFLERLLEESHSSQLDLMAKLLSLDHLILVEDKEKDFCLLPSL